MTEKSRGGRKPLLSQESILAAAVRVLGAEGLDALTMRRLGTELGVAAMSLYRHVPNRDALLALVVNELFARAMEAVRVDGGVARRLTELARAYREVLLAHPGAVPLLATHPVDLELGESLLAKLFDGDERVVTAVQSVAVFVLGHALAQVGTPHQDGRPTRSADRGYYDQWFEAGLAAMVRGFSAELPS
ncbi:hypothetical protein GCM10010174_59630 [Kutzneria viridogrisea]|uniref:HTH tetR-type domain-containing protein n=2 Tax=Kutzneria TaxID=43356 RepID=W5W3N0_9PSEU|nr:TetR family transcriptional regulator [Kutzneria albida]AHH95447.1 hypothetical protein KALB_2078 [Kutzneria albida DSM 43870]MBA8927194.1 AcrR family transcriptional regulator [Kutzneria viridogrisea]